MRQSGPITDKDKKAVAEFKEVLGKQAVIETSLMEQANRAFNDATKDGSLLWDTQHSAYLAGFLTKGHKISGLRSLLLLDPTISDNYAQKALAERMAKGWQFPGPGSTYDTGFADGLEWAVRFLLEEIKAGSVNFVPMSSKPRMK